MLPAPPSDRPRRGLFLGKLAVSLLLLGLLFWRAEPGKLLRTIQTLPLSIFLGCAALYGVASLISIVRWRGLLRAEGIRLALGRLTLIYFEAAFFNLFLPSLIGGDIFRAYAIYKTTGGHDASIPSVLLDRLTGFAALMLIAVVALGMAYRDFRDPQVALMILAVVVLFALVLLVLLHEKTHAVVVGLLKRMGLARFAPRIEGIVQALTRYGGHRGALLQAVSLSALLQAVIILMDYLVGVGLGVGVPLARFFLYVPLITALAMLPVSVAGLGVREGAVVFFFAKSGLDATTALSMSLLWFAVTACVSSLGGLAFLLDLHARKRQED